MKPPETKINPDSELKKTGHVDYWDQIIVKSFNAALQPWVNPQREITKQTGVSYDFFNGIYNQDKYRLNPCSIPNDKMPKPFLNNDNLQTMMKDIPTLASILG